MNWNAIGAIADALGALAVVLTLGALWHQMKQNTRALTTSTYESAMGGFNEVIRFLHGEAETSALVRRGFVEPAHLNDDEAFRFDFLLRFYVNHIYKLFRLYERGVFPPAEWSRVAAECAQLLAYSGGLQFRRGNDFYGDLWSELDRHGSTKTSDFLFERRVENVERAGTKREQPDAGAA